MRKMRATSAAPVAIVLARSAKPILPLAKRSPMTPRADDCRHQESRPCEFRNDPARERHFHSSPMRSISFLMASPSRLDKGKHKNRLIRRSRIMKASRNAFLYLFRRTCHGGGVRHSPVGSHRLAWPDGTNFFGRIVTDREHKMKFRCARSGKLVPILAASAVAR